MQPNQLPKALSMSRSILHSLLLHALVPTTITPVPMIELCIEHVNLETQDTVPFKNCAMTFENRVMKVVHLVIIP